MRSNDYNIFANEQEFLATKELVNGTFIMGEVNRLKKISNEEEFLATKSKSMGRL